jgi:hypothetical protein
MRPNGAELRSQSGRQVVHIGVRLPPMP